MGITSAGVGSGLDLEAIIKATVDAENLPKIAQFEKKESAISLNLTALGQIKSDLSAFDTQLDILKDITNFNKRSSSVIQPPTTGTNSSASDIISVTSTSDATVGKFDIQVDQLAQGSRAVMEDASSYSATTDVVTATGGTLTYTAGAKTFDVTLAAGATLADLRTAINDATDNFGISANIINTGGATPLSKLVLTSSETGSGNDLTVSGTTAELDKVSTKAFGGIEGSGGMGIATTDQAQDAIIYIDGIKTTSATNVFADSIQDTTITALKDDGNSGVFDSSTSPKATLDIATDKEFVKETIGKFVESFNKLIDTLGTVITSKTADSTGRGLKNTMINQIGSLVTGAGNLTSIYDIGISLDKNSNLIIDSTATTTLDEALTASYDDIGTLFSGAGNIGELLSSNVSLYLESGGIIKTQEDELTLQAKDMEDTRATHAYRMELFESRLREKYANLDVLIAGMKAQGSAVTSALDNLPGFTRQK